MWPLAIEHLSKGRVVARHDDGRGVGVDDLRLRGSSKEVPDRQSIRDAALKLRPFRLFFGWEQQHGLGQSETKIAVMLVE